MKCKCGSEVTITSGGNAGAVYCNKSAMLIEHCDGKNRCETKEKEGISK